MNIINGSQTHVRLGAPGQQRLAKRGDIGRFWMRMRGMRKRLYRLTYDKKELNRRALKIRRSLDEVKRILSGRSI